jgi:2,5-diamino-6-(ribosylamino)-4(3H)-pyrimidinone 5'-phosphate reductase
VAIHDNSSQCKKRGNSKSIFFALSFAPKFYLIMENKVYEQVESFLNPIYNNDTSHQPEDRPFITLTFAQSLDGMISKQDQQVLISGKESMAMAHRLRTLHDGIMVGIGTALIDDPQLNARYLSPTIKEIHQPQPIIMDPYLNLSPNCTLIKNYQSNIGKQVWLIASRKGCDQNNEKKLQLESLGVKIVIVETDQDRLPLSQVYKVLKNHGIKSLMIEGGSKIIQSCLLSNSFDQLIITIAPIFIGSDGVPAMTANQQDIMRLTQVKYQTLGNDIVMSAKSQ